MPNLLNFENHAAALRVVKITPADGSPIFLLCPPGRVSSWPLPVTSGDYAVSIFNELYVSISSATIVPVVGSDLWLRDGLPLTADGYSWVEPLPSTDIAVNGPSLFAGMGLAFLVIGSWFTFNHIKRAFNELAD